MSEFCSNTEQSPKNGNNSDKNIVFLGKSGKYIYELDISGELSITDRKTGELVKEMDNRLKIWNELDKAVRHKLKPQRRKYGVNGWVRLTDAELSRLYSEFGSKEVNRCIEYIDESAEINCNKNKWKNWNLVIRKCHREQWHKKRPQDEKQENRATSYDMTEFEERAKQLPIYKKRPDS